MPSDFIECEFCHYDFPDTADRCPHCGRPGIYVNVVRAEKDSEREALQRRYDAAMGDAQSRGCEAVVRDFEQAAANSRAVVARKDFVLQRMLSSDTEILGTYELELRAGLRLPKGEVWDVLRDVAGSTLFGAASTQIRFAALTLDEKGLFNYGDYVLFFREDMIAHRASVLEENSAVFVEHSLKTSGSPEVPPGFRATWQERASLCVAKLASQIGPSTKPGEYAKILLSASKTSADDNFVEVHIFGPVTVRTLDRVAVREQTFLQGSPAGRRKLEADLKNFHITLEVIR